MISLIFRNDKILGVKTNLGESFHSKTTIVTLVHFRYNSYWQRKKFGW